MKYCLAILRANRCLAAFYLLMGILTTFLDTWQAAYSQTVLDRFQTGSLSAGTIALYTGLMLGGYLLNYADEYPDKRFSNLIYFDFKLLALQKLERIDYSAYQRMGTGLLIQKTESGAQAGRGILFSFAFQVLRSTVPSITFGLWFIGRINPAVMVGIAAGYVLVFAVSNLLLKRLYKIKERILNNEEVLNRLLVRGFMELPVFRVNRRFRREMERAREAAGQIVSAKTKMNLIHEAFFTIFALFVGIIKVIILVYAWRTHALSVGAVVALLALAERAYQPIAVFNVLFVQYKLDLAAFRRLTEVLDAPEEPRLTSGAPYRPGGGGVKFENVGYTYAGNRVLDGLTLEVPAGKKAAFVGESGSGKSTCLKLIAGLLMPRSGRVFIDRQDIAGLSMDSYYPHIAYLSQETPVFDGTLREDILFDQSAPDAEIRAALERVELGGFLRALPEGLDTRVGERGATLSGGERQRLALARLFFTPARLILLDEATSALDNVTEARVLGRVMAALEGRTVVSVAHRIRSIQGADVVHVFSKGELIASGAYDDLLLNCAYFQALCARGEEPPAP